MDDSLEQIAESLGLSIIPCRIDKKPMIAWGQYQRVRASPERIREWLSQDPASWAVICGSVSGIFILDFDGQTGIITLGKLGLEPHILTPSGGAHVWFYTHGKPIRTLNAKTKLELGRRWPAMDVRGDGGYAIFAGRNQAGEYRIARALDPENPDVLPHDLKVFLGLAENPGDTGRLLNLPQPTGDRPPADALIWSALTKIDEGWGRNQAGFWLACQFRDNGYKIREAHELGLRDYVGQVPTRNHKGEAEPYTEEEWTASIRQAYTHEKREGWSFGGQKVPPPPDDSTRQPGDESEEEGKTEEQPDSRFRFWTVAEVIHLPPPEWLIDEIVPLDSLIVMFGAPGTGKSFLALDMALSVAYGVPWHGRDVHMGNVVYVAGEGFSGLRGRLKAWLSACTLDNPETADNGRFRACPDVPHLLDVRDSGQFVRAMRELKPKLVVIDTLARATGGGEENSARDMGMALSVCDCVRQEYGSAVLLVHHANKMGDIRGSTALMGAVDVCLSVTSCEPEDNEKQLGIVKVSHLTSKKVKDGPDDLLIESTLQVVVVGEDKKGRPLKSLLSRRRQKKGCFWTHGESLLLSALSLVEDEGGVSNTTWFKACDTIPEASFYRARKRLETSGYVERFKVGKLTKWRLTRKGQGVTLSRTLT